MLPVPSVDDLYASAATLGAVLLGFGAIVLLLIVQTELYYAVAHGMVAGWVLVVVAEQSSLKARVQGVTGA